MFYIPQSCVYIYRKCFVLENTTKQVRKVNWCWVLATGVYPPPSKKKTSWRGNWWKTVFLLICRLDSNSQGTSVSAKISCCSSKVFWILTDYQFSHCRTFSCRLLLYTVKSPDSCWSSRSTVRSGSSSNASRSQGLLLKMMGTMSS